jgi:hypothetical protein
LELALFCGTRCGGAVPHRAVRRARRDPRHRPTFGPFQLRASNGTNFSSVEIAEVIKISE